MSFQDFMNHMDLHIQEAPQTPSMMKSEIHTKTSNQIVKYKKQQENPRSSKRSNSTHTKDPQ